MRFDAEDYRWAALERIQAAKIQFDVGAYPECIYLAGLATECILRAYRLRSDPSFDSRHDLPDLLRVSGLENFVPDTRRPQLAAALADVWIRWKNDYRFASQDRLGREFRAKKLLTGHKGDALKANAGIALSSGQQLVGIGDARWRSLIT